MKNRICLVTGVSGGIGKATATALARLGATVVGVARDAGRGQAAVDAIRRETGNADVELLVADLSSQAAIRRLAAEYRSRHDRLHVLVNNAGVVLGEHAVTVDGLERTFATNHLAYFLLTNLLLDVLLASAPARVVSVSSDVHRSSVLDFDDLQFERRGYAPMAVYNASKLANVLWGAELARRVEGRGVTSNTLHPGVVASNLGQSGPGWMRIGVKLLRPLLLSEDKGAETSIHLATSPDVEGVTGKYFIKKKAVLPSAQARDADVARRLWDASEALTAGSAASAGV